MFELNLIKDKAKSRQRRRVIFLGIVTILFLSGLLAIVVGSLFWQELTTLKKVEADILSKKTSNDAIELEIGIEKPKAKKRRNAMIEAWTEDLDVRQNRPYFTPLMRDIADHYPKSAEFWYNMLQVEQQEVVATGVRADRDPTAGSKELMGTRRLNGTGYIQIEQSDVLTVSELRSLSGRMQSMVKLVGEPRFELDLSKEPNTIQDGGRYVPFTIQAAATIFSGVRP
ncbi:MAG: hypothetical protein IT464_14380 [Planctomycetes bacterium]|nr:hypothetical protein [Planctomycetota bacterium]